MLKKRLLLGAVFCVWAITVVHAEDFYFDSAGTKIHYTVEGQGEPVLLIHGFGGDLVNNWGTSGVIKGLSDRFQVIAMDNRGHGKSGKPHDAQAYGIHMVEDPIRLLDHLKIRKAHVVGYSMGGRITSLIVARYADRLRTAVLGGYGWRSPEVEQQWRGLLTQLAESLEQGNGITPLVQFLNPVGAPPPAPELLEAINRMFLATNDPLALAAVARGDRDQLEPTEGQLRANKVPVLALIGEADPHKTDVDKLNGRMSNAKIVVVPGADHMNAPGSPEFVKNLKSFLIEHSEGARKAAGTR